MNPFEFKGHVYKRVWDCKRSDCCGHHLYEYDGNQPNWVCVTNHEFGIVLTLLPLKRELFSLSPYDIVQVDMDNFSPYLHFDYPEPLREKIDYLRSDELMMWDDFETVVLDNLRTGGVDTWKFNEEDN